MLGRHIPVNFEVEYPPPLSSGIILRSNQGVQLILLPKVPLLRPNENKTEALHVLKPSKC